MDKLPRKTVFSFVGLILLYLLFFLFLDRPIDRWVHANLAGTPVEEWGSAISFLAYSPSLEVLLALLFIAGLVGVIVCGGKNRGWTSGVFFVCASCAAAIVIGEGLKIILGRYRPIMLFRNGQYGLSFFSTESARNSTPSGHTLRIFAIMTALSLLLPRGRGLFFAVAVLVGLSRVAVTAHYPSDVLFGAFIGIFSALWFCQLAPDQPALPPPRGPNPESESG